MAEIWKSQPVEVYQSWIDAIVMEASDNLTSWEMNFVQSVDDFLRKNQRLTEKQARILEKIYVEKTS